MTNKEKLKNWLVFSPREKRIELENFIDNEISDDDVLNALQFINENVGNHRIVNMGYSDRGDFSIKLETGVTYLK